MSVKEKISAVIDSVHAAEKLSGREVGSVKIIAVTKYRDADFAKNFPENGIFDLAENRVDKLQEKQKVLKDFPEIRWHLIGSLQRRKVRTIINQIDTFHALDSLQLAEEISKRALHKIKCFLEVNVSGEESKHGFTSSEVFEAVKVISTLSNVEIIGLMTMAPLDADDIDLHKIFSETKELQEQIKAMNLANIPCTELSMGMSRDYKIAIQEGATMVRIGSSFLEN
ncbi:MAG: YggS family pyridoxal phosphate-dependent enzyme [Streptococcaceae bacterium]|nr:YggS family pyridoxal phosphate-dependent enzyme [Streptococcaceae bacterium]